MAGRDATRKREREQIQYPISYARTTPPDANVRQREEKRKNSWEWRAKARRKESSTVYDTTRFLGIPQFREPIPNPPPLLPTESTERVCSPPSNLLYPPCGQISASQ